MAASQCFLEAPGAQEKKHACLGIIDPHDLERPDDKIWDQMTASLCKGERTFSKTVIPDLRHLSRTKQGPGAMVVITHMRPCTIIKSIYDEVGLDVVKPGHRASMTLAFPAEASTHKTLYLTVPRSREPDKQKTK